MASSFVLHPSSLRSRGFTLVEMIISIGIVVLVLVGVNTVFRTASDTAAVGQATSTTTRDMKAVQSVLANDWKGFATDGPVMAIRSIAVPAFLSAADDSGDRDRDPRTRDKGTGVETDLGRYIYHDGNHRIDMFAFFARGSFQRQTGSDTAFVTPTSSNEAWMWYGPLLLPNNLATPKFYGPGDPDTNSTNRNDNNRYATQWILGRRVILLRTQAPSDNKGYYPRRTGLTPLTASSTDISSTWTLQTSRFDLAQTSIDEYRPIVANVISSGVLTWWQQFVYNCYGNPFVGSSPTSTTVAQAVPCFLNNCSQFMVEYAGDFLTQDNNSASPTFGQVPVVSGAPVDASDGMVDFVVDKSADPTGADPTHSKWIKRIRWYGLPRNINTADDGATPMIRATGTGADAINQLIDVVPLRDVRAAAGLPTQVTGGLPGQAAFERGLSPAIPATGNYADVGTLQQSYTCVWGPANVKPSMLRITVKVNDPTGRLANGQIYEFVLGQP